MTLQSDAAEDLLKKQELLRLLEEHVTQRKDNSRKLWTMITFIIWLEQKVQRDKQNRIEDLAHFDKGLCEVLI